MRRRRLARVAAVALLAVAAGWAAWDYRETARLSASVQAISDAGEPLTLLQWKQPRPGDAAAFYAAAIQAGVGRGPVKTSPVDTLSAIPPDGVPPPYVTGAAAGTVSRYQDAIAFADQGAPLEFVAFQLDPAASPRGGEPATLSRVLEMRAYLEALGGDGEAAVAALVSCLRFYRAFNDVQWPPGLASVRGDQVQAVLERTTPSAASLAALDAALASLDRDDTFPRYLMRDRTLLIQEQWTTLRGILPAGLTPYDPVDDRLTIRDRLVRPVRRFHVADRLQMLAAVIDAAARPPLLPSVMALASRPRGYFVLESRLGLHGWETPGIRSTWLRRYPIVATRYVRGQAIARAARVAIALEQYRRGRGSWPSSLDALAGAAGTLPPDPMTGQPLKYLLQPGQFLVYSVGEDGRDDGGAIDEIDEAARVAQQRISSDPDWGIRVRFRTR